MKYYSLNNNSKNVGFIEAIERGLAPDRGLYFPSEIPELSNYFVNNIKKYSDHEIAFQVINPFVGNEIPNDVLKGIIKKTLKFNFPIVNISKNIASLELFQGPTLAFKDVGARFMANCLSYANLKEKENKKITVLVATSGDTGGAVANGFYKFKNIDVVILFPKGKVSEIQEYQLTTLGKNITALEVEGSFDDCQNFVKNAFIDPELIKKINLTSANSINVGRWLAQMFYYFIAYRDRPNPDKELIVSVPSGNFGNICAGLVSKKMGLPISHFIASTNSNDTIPRFLNTGIYKPKKSIQTISNAMDVANPSNFLRIQKLFNNDIFGLKKSLTAYSYSDKQTEKAINKIYKLKNYITDPHGAVGYLGLIDFLNSKKEPENYQGLFLETAHPIKFSKTVEKIIKEKIEIPNEIKNMLKRKKMSTPIKDYNDLKSILFSK